jgi:nitrite reductase/ring-hydroxylating ferredoxin subunit
MSNFVTVARLEEIPDQTARCVEAGGRRIALVNLGGEIFAVDDTCTHAEASLCEGSISGDEIVCPLHMATFDIRTGRATGPPASQDLVTYAVRVNGDEVQVEVG